MKSKKEMMRVLKTSEDTFELDATGKKNGRGAYLCFSKECFEKAGSRSATKHIYFPNGFDQAPIRKNQRVRAVF